MKCFIIDCGEEAEHAVQIFQGRAADLCSFHKAEMDRELDVSMLRIVESLRERIREQANE